MRSPLPVAGSTRFSSSGPKSEICGRRCATPTESSYRGRSGVARTTNLLDFDFGRSWHRVSIEKHLFNLLRMVSMEQHLCCLRDVTSPDVRSALREILEAPEWES